MLINSIRRFFLYSLWLLISMVVSIAVLELFFRFLPVAEVFDKPVVNDDQPILKYEPNKKINYSLGPDFYKTIQKSSNNYGYTSDFYYAKSGKPSFVVIGDSYVEAMQVSNANSLSARLAYLLKTEDIYSLGVSGSALSQYLAFARFAEKEFDPKAFVFIIVGNDFDESLCEIRPLEGHHCFDDSFSLTLIPFQGFSFARNLARNSALMRYAILNAHINWRSLASKFGILRNEVSDARLYVGNTDVQKNKEITSKSLVAIDVFISQLGQIAKNKSVYIVMDADRQQIYNNKPLDVSYFLTMKDYMKKVAKDNGFIVIDMEDGFKRDYKKNQLKFEFKTDGHWNEHGHQVVANELYNNLSSQDRR
jgi:hypothetical protein